MRLKIVSSFLFLLIGASTFAQDDLMDMLEEEAKEEVGNEKIMATFKTQKLINAHTTESVKAKTLDFRVTHRFSNLNSTVHNLYGLDNVDDIRISFDYGITDYFQIGIGRSKRYELIDGSIKFRPLTQTVNNKVPVSVAIVAQMGFTPRIDPDSLYEKVAHRFNYTWQMVIARKFGQRISVELLPTYNHRNIVRRYVNDNNGAEEKNDIFALGVAGRVKITQRVAILADYYYVFSKYRQNNPETAYYNPLGIGLEIETGGHVFHMTATNAVGIVEGNYLPNTIDSWKDIGIKVGFNISRVFNVGKR